MSDRNGNALLIPLLAALGAAAAAIPVMAHTATEGPLRCEILATPSNGGIALEGLAHTEHPVSGSYEFRVTGGGSGGGANIRQSGDFEAGADETAELGNVMLGGSGSVYDARLEVTANGVTVICEERI